MQVATARPIKLTAEQEVDEEVFRQAFIPRRLEEVANFERDFKRLQAGQTEGIYFQTMTGMAQDGEGIATEPKVLQDARRALAQIVIDNAARDAESARDNAESARDDAESARDDAESARDDVESARDDAAASTSTAATTATASTRDAGGDAGGNAALESRLADGTVKSQVASVLTAEGAVGGVGFLIPGAAVLDACESEEYVSDEDSDEDSESGSDDEEGSEDGKVWVERAPVDKDAVRSERKDNKVNVKEAKKEKRLTKVPKKVKKKAIKKGKFKK